MRAHPRVFHAQTDAPDCGSSGPWLSSLELAVCPQCVPAGSLLWVIHGRLGFAGMGDGGLHQGPRGGELNDGVLALADAILATI